MVSYSEQFKPVSDGGNFQLRLFYYNRPRGEYYYFNNDGDYFDYRAFEYLDYRNHGGTAEYDRYLATYFGPRS